MCVPRVYDSSSDLRKSRKKYFKQKKDTRYKILAIVGLTLLVLEIIIFVGIWIAEYKNSHRLGIAGQQVDDYQIGKEVDNFFEQDKHDGVSRSVRDSGTQNMTGSGMNTTTDSPTTEDPLPRRQFPPDIFTLEQKRQGAITLHIAGIIYMFCALALVCDEFFVPSLEIIIEKFHIPEDVAGATFMAAGGSAPEFFTSLVGVFFARNAVGFGTIVGSAVFNILFVIGVVGLLTKSILLLTSWPLFRDTTFYAVALAALVGFLQNGQVAWYESLSLFSLYVLYVLFMLINSHAERFARKCVNYLKDKLCCCTCTCSCTKSSSVHSAPDTEAERCTTGHSGRSTHGSTILVRPREPSDDSGDMELLPGMVPTSHHTLRISSARNPSRIMINSEASTGNLYPVITESMPTPGVEPKSFKLPPLAKPQLLTKFSTRTLLDLPNRRSSNDSGFRTNSSCAGSEIGSPTSHAAISRLNSDRSLVITNSQAVMTVPDSPYMEEVESVVFLDSKTEEDKNLFIRRRSFSDIPNGIHCSAPSLRTTTACSNSEEKDDSKEETPKKSEDVEGGESGEQDQKEEEEEEEEGIVHIIPPKGWVKRIFYILFLPLIILLFFTLPDIKKPRFRCLFPIAFIGSVLWIGVFSYFMVWWATEFGDTANIPPSVMGLTFLAAGTSIPDLITSVIVARKGHGDMALSSSIGSNMFDVTVGLPIPWLLFSAVNGGQPVSVLSNGLFCSVLLLVGMLIVMIVSIALFRWKLGKLLGLTYIVMYLVFVALSILLELVIHCTIGG